MEELKKIIIELIEIFKELIPVEKGKMAAASGYNVVVLEESMKKEQAAILRLRGLDQKRESLLKDIGCSGKTLRQILEEISDAQRTELKPLFEELEQQIKIFRGINDDTNEIIRTNLHVVENMTADNGVYPKQEARPEKETHYTSRKA